MSNDPVNQTVAQGGLTQMVNHVFARCKTSFEGADRESVTDSGINLISSRRGSVALASPDSVPPPSLPVGGTTSEGEGEATQEGHNEDGTLSVGSLQTSPAYS
jgi:brefeldin A-inhibited guanine nucleotide-exchange protein